MSRAEDLAFDNFFHDYVMNKPHDVWEWGPDYWRPWGMMVQDSQLVFDSAAARAWFILRWS